MYQKYFIIHISPLNKHITFIKSSFVLWFQIRWNKHILPSLPLKETMNIFKNGFNNYLRTKVNSSILSGKNSKQQ